MDENIQASHYSRIHDEYGAHYYDEASTKYREEFIYSRLFHDIDLNNKEVADLACGVGVVSQAILARYPLAKTTGFDISTKACEAYKTNLSRPGFQIDLTIPMRIETQYDAVVIFGGLHHCVVDLPTTLENISNLIKPGGSFLLFEPNAEFFLEGIRKLWYQYDNYFESSSEHALSHNEIFSNVKGKFELINVTYFGGPAYYLILNSLILRIPLKIKLFLYFPLKILEQLYNCLPGKFWFPSFVAHWKKL